MRRPARDAGTTAPTARGAPNTSPARRHATLPDAPGPARVWRQHARHRRRDEGISRAPAAPAASCRHPRQPTADRTATMRGRTEHSLNSDEALGPGRDHTAVVSRARRAGASWNPGRPRGSAERNRRTRSRPSSVTSPAGRAESRARGQPTEPDHARRNGDTAWTAAMLPPRRRGADVVRRAGHVLGRSTLDAVKDGSDAARAAATGSIPMTRRRQRAEGRGRSRPFEPEPRRGDRGDRVSADDAPGAGDAAQRSSPAPNSSRPYRSRPVGEASGRPRRRRGYARPRSRGPQRASRPKPAASGSTCGRGGGTGRVHRPRRPARHR